MADRQSWLRRVIPVHLYVTKATEAHQIVDCIRIHFNVQINYESARLAKSSLVKDRRQHQCQLFTKVPAYIALLQQTNPEVIVHLQTVPNIAGQQAFQRLFICPSNSHESFTQMRKLIAVDRTFLKARFVQTLLLAVISKKIPCVRCAAVASGY